MVAAAVAAQALLLLPLVGLVEVQVGTLVLALVPVQERLAKDMRVAVAVAALLIILAVAVAALVLLVKLPRLLLQKAALVALEF